MKKFLIASGVAVLALASVASAQGYQFSTNLTVGSTGPDVVALQTWLIANGYHIASIESGAAAKGYFGSQTKAAVAKYQAASSLPSTGFFGPLTRGLLNGGAAMAGAVNTMTCPAGYVCTQVGATTPTGTVSAPVGISTPGIPGTLAPSIWNSPSNGTVVYKGQSYDVVAYKLQASASDMAVQSISLDFNTRLWLYASAITLKDDTGAVVGQVTNLNSSNFTELTVGSDYRLTVPITNYVVKAAQTRYVTANVTLLPTSDRASGLIGVTNAQFRSVDGTGVTDTESVSSNITSEVGGGATLPSCSANANCRYFSYQGSGAGTVVVTVDATSPLAGLVQISTGGQTQGVPLAVYDIKSQNAPSVLRAITFVVNTTGAKTPQDLFSQYNLKIGGQTVGAQTVTPNNNGAITAGAASTTVTFTNFGSVNLPADTYVPLTLTANVQSDTNNALDGTIASTTLVVAGTNPDVEDQSYTTLGVNAGTFISSNLTFSGSSATLSNLAATLGSAVTGSSGSATITTGYNVSFSFTVTAGNNSLFLSANPNIALSTSSSGWTASDPNNASSSLTVAGVVTNPGQISGDTNVNSNNGFYVVPAGSSRQFTFNGAMDNTNGSKTFKSFSITAVKYGTTTSSLTSGTINYNLQPLKVTATF